LSGAFKVGKDARNKMSFKACKKSRVYVVEFNIFKVFLKPGG
jgi:hypothetical protein